MAPIGARSPSRSLAAGLAHLTWKPRAYHSAADTEYDWSFYGGLVGAYFASHPDIQTATIHREDAKHPSTVSLPDLWVRTDEWYNFQTNPCDRPDIQVLASLDEASYAGGRAWHTAGGHTIESSRPR